MKILSTLKTSTYCVNENHSFYIYRADTDQVLARGLDGYEAAKTAANHLRHSLGLKWDQVGFKKETKPTGTNSASGGGNSRSRSTGARYDRSSRYNPSKRGHFRGYYGTDGSYHDIDWRNHRIFWVRGGVWNSLVLLMVVVVLMKCWRSLRTVWWVLKGSFGPGALDDPWATRRSRSSLYWIPYGDCLRHLCVVLTFFSFWSWWSKPDALLDGSQELPWGSLRTYSHTLIKLLRSYLWFWILKVQCDL